MKAKNRGSARRCLEKKRLCLSFSSQRIRMPGRINDLTVSDLTIDTVSDITSVLLLFLKLIQRYTKYKALIEPVPPSCMSLSASNGSPLEILGFIHLSVT